MDMGSFYSASRVIFDHVGYDQVVQRIEDIATGQVKGLNEDEFRSRLAREKRR